MNMHELPGLTGWSERVIRSPQRARKLRRRGEIIQYRAETRDWVWAPMIRHRHQFVCPNCMSTHWGTNNMKRSKDEPDVYHGRCHNQWAVLDAGCKFSWPRTDDALYFIYGRAPTPATVLNHHIRQGINSYLVEKYKKGEFSNVHV